MATFGPETTGNEVVERFRDVVDGKTVLITGASQSGLGAETAISLATGNPSQLILLARSLKKVDPVINNIKKINANIDVVFVPIELDKQSSILKAVDQIRSNPSVTKIDVVINNAGIMGTDYSKNDAGIESQLATNHIGHFYLTKLLSPLVAAAGNGARIVNLSSDGYKISSFRFDDYNFSGGDAYDRWSGYGQSKTANILFTRYLAKHLAHKQVYSFAVHPGVITSTTLSNSLDMEMFGEIPAIAKRNTGVTFVMGNVKNIQQGVSTTLVAALDPSLCSQSGSMLTDCKVIEILDYASSDENADKLWKLSEKLIGEHWDLSSW